MPCSTMVGLAGVVVWSHEGLGGLFVYMVSFLGSLCHHQSAWLGLQTALPTQCLVAKQTERRGMENIAKFLNGQEVFNSETVPFFVIKRVETPNFKEFFWVFTLHTRNASMFHLVLHERDLQSLVWWGTPTLTPSFAIRVLHETVSSQREVFLCISVSCLAESTRLINVEHGLGFI